MHRKRLVATAAAAPLLFFASGAFAETQITTAVVVPVKTSDTNQDVRVTNTGSIKPTVTGPALKQDTSNSITNEGTIGTTDVDDSVGMQGTGGLTGNVVNSGVISINETYTATDSNSNGYLDGEFAHHVNRYGILVTGGTGPMIGDVKNNYGASITVQGKNSAGISIESGLAAGGTGTGSLIDRGSISVTGENSYGVHTTGDIAGGVALDGAITAQGTGAVGAAIDSNVGGQVHIQNGITATGYRSTARPQATYDANGNLIQPTFPSTDPSLHEIDIGGPAVRISGNVGQGILLDVRPTADATNPDVNGNGIPDTQESNAAIFSYGTAPALLIGSQNHNVTIGAVGSGSDLYGLISKGTIQANGVYDGKASTALQIGDTGGYLTNITGGIRLDSGSSIMSTAYQADSTAVRFVNGATLTGSSTLWNSGTITAQLVVTGIPTGVLNPTDLWFTATAIQLDAGSHVTTLINDGTILAELAGNNSDAVAIRDLSGSLTSITNTGVIRGLTVSNTSTTLPFGALRTPIAIDVSANTSGVTITQNQSSVTGAAAPVILGNVLFGSGADTLTLNAGTLSGAMSFGAGADTLNITGGAVASGVLTDDATGQLTINVADGKLAVGIDPTTGLSDIQSGRVINATSLTVGATSSLVVTLDPTKSDAEAANLFNVGTANFATGSQVGVQLTGGLIDFSNTAEHTYTIVQANSLTAGTINQDLLGLSPYIYKVGVVPSTTTGAAGTLDITIRRRTAQEAGLNVAETGAYDAFYTALSADTGVRDVFLNQATTRESFLRYYDQLLPEQEEGLFSALDYASSDIAQTVANRPDPRSHYGPDSFWIHEINTFVKRDPSSTLGSNTKGFGFVGGYESMSARGGALGATLAYMTAEERDKPAEVGEHTAANLFELGLYWRQATGPWLFSVRGGAGYVMLDDVRKFIAPAIVSSSGLVTTPAVIRTSKASWSGYTGSASASAAYEARMGRYYVRPTLGADYFYLNEGGYSEKSDSDLTRLHVASRNSYRLAGVAKVVIGADYGREVWWRPELTLGYRNVFAGQIGDTVASFGSGSPFTLAASDPKGGAAIVGLALKAGTPMSYVAAEVQMEKFRHEYRYNALLSGRVMF